jgi:ArsR family transcriptional regulator, virulence genes transcriptional regulator
MKIEALEAKAEQASGLLAAMANEKRLMILCQLLDGEKSVSELASLLDVRPSTISQHLALLRKDRLVATRREAQSLYYSLAGDEARAILDALYRLYCAPRAKAGPKRSPRVARRTGG